MAKKRTNGEGSYSQRADGRWCWKMMDGYTPEGKPNTVVIYGKTQKEVKEKVKQYQRDKEDGLKIDRKLTFSAWADTWFESLSGVEESTKEGYRYTARKLKEHFGKRKLVDIRPLDVENYIHEMQQNGLSDSYIAKLRGMLFQIMNKAAANDLIRKNPVQYAEKSKSVNPPKEKEAFTAEEVRLLMEKLPENRLGWSIRLMLGTGMRGQELLALQKEHIEEDGSVIHIRQAVKLVKGKTTIGPPKSKSSTRDIPVPAGLRKYAVALRSAGGDFVWEGAIPGQPYDARHFRDHFKSALKAIPGVRVLTPHSCRHTYVTQMQALGVDLQTIQSIAGHADLDMTEHYLHVQQSVKEAAVSKFDAAFFSQTAVQAAN